MSNRTLLVIALTAGVIAAILTQRQLASADRSEGPRVAVLIARQAVSAGTVLDDPAVFERRTQPTGLAPSDALQSADETLGRRTAIDLAPGSYVTESSLAATASEDRRLRRGERALSVDARISPADAEPSPGAQVDLIASGTGGSTDAELLVTGAEVLAAEPGENGSHRLTLRLAAAQTVRVARADVFARELRALIVP